MQYVFNDYAFTLARNGLWDGVEAALATGLSVNASNLSQQTLLHFAAGGEGGAANRRALHRLLDAGADVHARCSRGDTPLHWAAVHGTAPICGDLLRAGASSRALNHLGESPVVAAVRAGVGLGPEGLARVGALLRHPDAVPGEVFRGRTVEQWAREKGLLDIADAVASAVGSFFFGGGGRATLLQT
jgi:ankyrin repeat protein